MTDFDLGRIIPIDKGEWNDTYSTDAGPGYEKFDIVTSGSGSYLSLVANNTAPLTDRASWFPYVDGASIDALVVALNTAKQNAITATESANAKALFAEEKGNLADTKAGEADAAKVAANTAAAAASTAAGNANDAATAANSAAGLANTARTELTTAVNTKLDEADGKIEEMNTTLSTYDGRVAQVEEDIDQLADEVSDSTEKAGAASLSELNARLLALEKIVSATITNKLEVTKEFNVWGKTNLILTGSGAATFAPDFIGQKYIDTTGGNIYVAVGVATAGNWKLV